MEEVLQYLKDCRTFYLASCDGDQARVRPFGAVCLFEEKIYIITNNKKPVYDQMMKNPKIEISGMSHGTWIRLQCEVVLDTRREARVAMIEEYGSALSRMYSVDDNLMEVFYLQNAKAVIQSLAGEKREILF